MDCNDSDATIHPGAPEGVGDEVDQDCDGVEICYADGDRDGYTSGTVSSSDIDCSGSGEAPGASGREDCDDGDATIHPGAAEVCDDEQTDEDCDGLADDDDVSVDRAGYGTWYADLDGDGYGDAASVLHACDPPDDSASDDTDCDDTDPGVNPAAAEVAGDGIDQDCDGVDEQAPTDDGEDDDDGDKSGCSCSTGDAPPSGLVGLVGLGLVGWRRRRG